MESRWSEKARTGRRSTSREAGPGVGGPAGCQGAEVEAFQGGWAEHGRSEGLPSLRPLPAAHSFQRLPALLITGLCSLTVPALWSVSASRREQAQPPGHAVCTMSRRRKGLEEAAKGPGGGPWEALAPRAAAPRADPGGGCSHKGRRAEQPGGEAGWAEGAVFLSWSSMREFESRREAGAGGHVSDGVSSAPSLLGYGPCVPTCAVRITPCAPRPRRLLWKAAPASVHVICWPGLAESML